MERHASQRILLRKDQQLNTQRASTPGSQRLRTHAAKSDCGFTRNFSGWLASLGLAAVVLASTSALAQVAPSLNTAGAFTALGSNAIPTIGTFTCSDTGPGVGVFGQVGTTFNGGITNAPPCLITGPVVSPVPASVVNDFRGAGGAFNTIDTLNPVCTGVIPIATVTLPPGVYCSAAGTTMGAGVIITLLGNATDVWIFRVGTGGLGGLTLTNAQVVMGGTASPCNVYWKSAQATAITDSSFVGTVLSGAGATMTRGTWTGRAFATTDVTLTDPNLVGCTAAGGGAGAAGAPTLSEWMLILLAGLLAIVGFAALRPQPPRFR